MCCARVMSTFVCARVAETENRTHVFSRFFHETCTCGAGYQNARFVEWCSSPRVLRTRQLCFPRNVHFSVHLGMDKKMENLVLKWTLGREGAKGSALQRGLHLPFTVSEYPFWTRAVSAQLETHKTVSAAGGGGYQMHDSWNAPDAGLDKAVRWGRLPG